MKRYQKLSLLACTAAIAVQPFLAGDDLSGEEPELVEPATREGETITFVYLHGFGGKKESPKFCENFREFLKEVDNDSEVINYEWDSVKVDPLRAGASWIKSQEMAKAEAPRYKREVIDKLEAKGEPYVLVAFSVGSRVVLDALDSSEEPLKHLRGVYFLGSAMTKDATLKNERALPPGMKIVNYHSPTHDMVHQMAFNFMSDLPAGGKAGFDDKDVFENHPVACTHAHKGVGFAIDYSSLAEAIGFLELYQHGVVLDGRTKINWETPVMEGEVWWNRIATYGEYDLQQHNTRKGYYRAIKIGEDGKRTRVARGENPHAILQQLKVKPGK